MCIRDRLLAADQRDERVDGRNARADVVARIRAAHRVDGAAVDVRKFFGIDAAEAVDRLARAVEDAPHDLGGEGKLHRLAGKTRAHAVQRQAEMCIRDRSSTSLSWPEFSGTAEKLKGRAACAARLFCAQKSEHPRASGRRAGVFFMCQTASSSVPANWLLYSSA